MAFSGYGDDASDADALGGRMKLLESKLENKIFFHREAMIEYVDMKHIMGDLTEVRDKVDQACDARVAAAHRELLAPVQEQLAAAKEELARKSRELEQKDEELKAVRLKLQEHEEGLEAVRLKLQEHEAMKNQDVQLKDLNGAASDHVQIQPMRRQTRSMQMAENKSSGNELEVLRDKMIKGFMELEGGRTIGVKEMGKLDEKPFQAACAEKLPPKEAEKMASKLYSTWENLLNNPSWNQLTVEASGNREKEVTDVNDENLQELRREWGEGPYKSVRDALVERRENHFGGTFAYHLWNYKEGRKSTLGECIEYMIDQVKQLKVARRRKSRRLNGTAL